MQYEILIGPYKGQIAELVGEIDYSGCKNGWHTLRIGETVLLYAGDEIRKLEEK